MHRSIRNAGIAATLTLLLSTTAMAADTPDAEVLELKAQLKAMSARLEALEAQKTAAPAAASAPATDANGFKNFAAAPPPQPVVQVAPLPAAGAGAPAVVSGAPAKTTVKGEGMPVVGGSLPGSFKLPGTDTSMKLGGYAKLDAIYDANHAYGGQFANFANIPLNNSQQGQFTDQFNMHARQTRLNIETSTPTALGPLKILVEADFFGAAAGNRKTLSGEGLQLRHAYGQVGNILAGQTWSNFMDLDAYPESLDFVGPAGLSFIRQAQIRYTDKIGEHTTWSVSAESPQSDITSPVTTNINVSDMPDLTGKVQYKDTFGHVAVRGLVRHLKEGSTAAGTTGEDGAYAYGLGLSGKFLAYEKDSLVYEINAGKGIGRYIFDVANSNNGSVYTPGGQVEAQFAYSAYAAYQHYWSPNWRTNIMAGYVNIDNNTSVTGLGVNKDIASAHLNLIWSPDPAYRVGLEYMHGYRELESGVSGDLDRIQTSFMYLF